MYSTNVGDYLIIWITGLMSTYIAEVIRHDPLKLKVIENDPHFSCLKEGDVIIQKKDTEQFQKDCREKTNVFLETEYKAGRKVISGLESLGVKDGKFHEIFARIRNKGE